MAVFTKLKKQEIEDFLKNFSIGELISFEGIVKGSENSNFKIITSKNKYILTILEKRVEEEDLPFFMSLQNELVEHGFNCPKPIKNNNNLIINKLKNKNAVIISFLEGENLSLISKRYNVKIQDITSMNKISAKKYLQPGQVLQIPTQGYDEYVKSLINTNNTTKIYHTVKSGDTLSEIASKYRTSIKKIKKWNGIRENDNVIYVGKKLIIFISANDYQRINTNTPKTVNYKVKYGDSLSKISYKFGVRVSDIRKWNNLKSDLIKVGQNLIIKTKN